jgi:hypothetical protein
VQPQAGQTAIEQSPEVICAKFPVNMEQGGLGYGGRVKVTNQRITFTPIAASRASGGRDWEIPLGEIVEADVAPREMRVNGGAWRHRLRLRTQTGAAEYFVVWRPRRQAAVINRILSSQGVFATRHGGRHTR